MQKHRLLSLMRQAVNEYSMIDKKDVIAVGLSGGKDSLALLSGLSAFRRFEDYDFSLFAITVDMGFGTDLSAIKKYCEEENVPLHIVNTQISKIIFDLRNETNPCSLCSKMRKGALNEAALSLGCNKVALGHNKDDAVETFVMSLFYEGRLRCFEPVTKLDKTALTYIRPLMYIKEKDIRGYANKYNLPVTKSGCPADGNTARQTVKDFLALSANTFPNVDKCIFSAIKELYK